MNNFKKITSPFVSVITPSFNSSKYIHETYNSLKNQTHTNWEWLVTDDCSSDNTFEILLNFAHIDSRVKPKKNNINLGAGFSRNNSLERASGEFIAFIDSDDIWVEKKLEQQLQFMETNKDFSFTAYSIIDAFGNFTGKNVDAYRCGSFSYIDILKKSATIGCSTVILRRSAFDDISMPLIRTGQDYALWLKLLKTGKRAHVLGVPLTYYRTTPNSISRNKFKKAIRQWYIYRNFENISIPNAFKYFLFYAWRAIFRR